MKPSPDMVSFHSIYFSKIFLKSNETHLFYSDFFFQNFLGLDDKRTVPSTYEPPPTPVRFNRNRESKDREILNQYSSPTSPTTTTSGFSTGSWRRNSTKSANSQNSSTAPHSPIPTRFENNKSSENNHYSRNTVSENLKKVQFFRNIIFG